MAKRSTKVARVASTASTDVVVGSQPIAKAYHVTDLKPKATGPWTVEHEKLAWTDPKTGLDCIVRRMGKGHFGAFVAVPRAHPLHAYSAEAIPPGLLRTHGGIDYAQACDNRGPEDRSICHVHRGAFEGKDDVWWIGTSCDEIGDLVPDDPSHAAEARRLGIEQVYRNEHYAVELCTTLAHDLAAVGELR